MASNSYVNRYGSLIAQRDGGWYCHYCGIALVPKRTPTTNTRFFTFDKAERKWVKRDDIGWPSVDHIIPKSQGGRSNPKNMVLACRRCNSAKSSTPYHQFIKAW